MLYAELNGDGLTCKGDSGGPLIVRGATAAQDIQIGVTSWSNHDDKATACRTFPGGLAGAPVPAAAAAGKWNAPALIFNSHQLFDLSQRSAAAFANIGSLVPWIVGEVVKLTGERIDIGPPFTPVRGRGECSLAEEDLPEAALRFLQLPPSLPNPLSLSLPSLLCTPTVYGDMTVQGFDGAVFPQPGLPGQQLDVSAGWRPALQGLLHLPSSGAVPSSLSCTLPSHTCPFPQIVLSPQYAFKGRLVPGSRAVSAKGSRLRLRVCLTCRGFLLLPLPGSSHTPLLLRCRADDRRPGIRWLHLVSAAAHCLLCPACSALPAVTPGESPCLRTRPLDPFHNVPTIIALPGLTTCTCAWSAAS